MLRQMDPLASWTPPVVTPGSARGTATYQELPPVNATSSHPAPYAHAQGSAVHSSLRFHSSAASSGVATLLGARSAHLS